jgi:predicted tellurium resistance membrane protein TerC
MPDFSWSMLGMLIFVSIVLSGGTAMVIALAVRSLPLDQRLHAILWGTIAAMLSRELLVQVRDVALALAHVPFHDFLGGIVLFWIAITLMAPERDREAAKSLGKLIVAIVIIVVADLVTAGLEYVRTMHRIVPGSDGTHFIFVGIFAVVMVVIATLLSNAMKKWPVVTTISGALLGWVAGELLVSDYFVRDWIGTSLPWMQVHIIGVRVGVTSIVGAAIVVFVRKRKMLRAGAWPT